MNIEEIRKAAPKGATHYISPNGFNVYYCKIVRSQLHVFDDHIEAWMPLYGRVDPKPL